MEPIRVPGPPAEAYNKNRRISDLIRAQVNHFKHLEYKLSAQQRKAIPQHEITTEGDAAKYIAAMTAFLLAQPTVKPKPAAQAIPGPQLVGAKRPAPVQPEKGIAIAASADPAVPAGPGVPAVPAAPTTAREKGGSAARSKPGSGAKGRGPAPRGKK